MKPEMLKRPLNVGFSGGEKKRMEIFQMMMLEPRFIVMDETDSGLDVDALRIVADGVNKLRSPDITSCRTACMCSQAEKSPQAGMRISPKNSKRKAMTLMPLNNIFPYIPTKVGTQCGPISYLTLAPVFQRGERGILS